MSNFTTADFLIDNGIITGLTTEGRTKIDANDGVIDSFPIKATAIGYRAFDKPGITTIKDWGNITSIGDAAFCYNQITTLPDNWSKITSIGSYGRKVIELSYKS